jgi:ribosome-associated toxin RatA of RatAB toxin-antitoxin module
MAQAQRSEVFPVNRSAFYQTVIDYDAYPEFIDTIVDAKTLETWDKGARVQFTAHVVKNITYVLELTHKPERIVTWELVEGEIFKKVSGSWDLKARGKNKTEAVYTTEVEAKVYAPPMLVKQLVKHGLPKLMNQFYERALLIEGEG